MGKDYYAILEIKRDASQELIIQAYRRLALKFHPVKNPDKLASNSYKFAQVSEAYDVLSDANKRAIFDQYGEELLKEGVTDSKGHLKGGYAFLGNSFEIFEEVFGNSSPFIDLVEGEEDIQGSIFGDSFKAQGEAAPSRPSDLEVVLEVTLQECYLGCEKAYTVNRQTLALDGKHTKFQSQKKTIEVKPGYGSKTVIRLPGQGHESFGHKNSKQAKIKIADLVIRFKEAKNPRYSRKDNDLFYIHTLSLVDAINAQPFNVTTLDGRVLQVGVDSIITPQMLKEVKGEGMPIYDENPLVAMAKANKRGNLYVRFDIVFPKYIPETKKEVLREILKEEEEVE